MSLKEQRPWYENALLLAVAGSIIAVIGQFAGTVIPIMYGPGDSSDFSVSLTSNWVKVIDGNRLEEPIVVKVEDLHPVLRPYKFGVYLRALQVPPTIQVNFAPPQISEIKSDRSSKMSITFPGDLVGEFPITIQGVGGDGKSRNTTFFLELL